MNSKTQEFSPWMHVRNNDLASFDQCPDNIRRKAYLLTEGVGCRDWFPEDVEFKMDDNKGLILADSIPNGVLFLIVSEKLKAILEKEVPGEIEFLPIQVLDHQKNKIEARYYIANVLTVVLCMDYQKSVYVMSALDKTQVHHFKNLVLDNAKIPENTKIFRLGEETTLTLVRYDLIKVIIDSGCTGMSFIDIKDYGKQYRPVDRVALAKKLLENR
jgi:hypothetical protein